MSGIFTDDDKIIGPQLRKATKVLNLGCGFVKMKGATNVDKFSNCMPDLLWDLDEMPWPIDDFSYDIIYMDHVLEHLKDWWGALRECARVLKYGGWLLVFVPDASNIHARAYRDHLHTFTVASFHNFQDGTCSRAGTNAFAQNEITEYGPIPLRVAYYKRIPFDRYKWMEKWCPWLLKWCATHMFQFIDEQHIGFEKINWKVGKEK